MKEIPNLTVANLHRAFCESTGIKLPLNRLFGHEYSIGAWLAHGWTEDDLRLVVTYIRKNFKDYWLRMVTFPKLIEDHTNFANRLGEARAWARNATKPRDARTEALAAVNRSEQGPQAKVDTERPAGAVAKEILDAGYEKMRKALE